MEVIFRAFDGQEFKSAEECINHEKLFPKFKMWSDDGLTTDPDAARVVWFSEQVGAKETFCKLCQQDDITAEGIVEDMFNDNNLYLWSDDLFQWVAMDKLTIDAVKHYVTER